MIIRLRRRPLHRRILYVCGKYKELYDIMRKYNTRSNACFFALKHCWYIIRGGFKL